MPHLNRQPSEWSEPHSLTSPPCGDDAATASLRPNVLTGMVISGAAGLTKTTYRIRIGERTDLHVRWPLADPARRTLETGQPVHLTIPQEAVQLEAGGFRRGKQRWNRWVGRVVLASPHGKAGSTTVKIHQDPITLKSSAPVIGARVPLTTWDTVNVVIDPQRIQVCHCIRASAHTPPPRRSADIVGTPTSVWLRTVVRAVRAMPTALHLTLSAGDVTLSVLIEVGTASAAAWQVGDSLEVNIGHGDAWVRQQAQGPIVPCCIVLSSEFDEARSLGFVQQHDRSRAAASMS